jgi:hypothetical protein
MTGSRVPRPVVHLCARMVVGLGRNRHGLRGTSINCGTWSRRRWPGRSCWRQRRTAGSSLLGLRRSWRRGVGLRRGMCRPRTRDRKMPASDSSRSGTPGSSGAALGSGSVAARRPDLDQDWSCPAPCSAPDEGPLHRRFRGASVAPFAPYHLHTVAQRRSRFLCFRDGARRCSASWGRPLPPTRLHFSLEHQQGHRFRQRLALAPQFAFELWYSPLTLGAHSRLTPARIPPRPAP